MVIPRTALALLVGAGVALSPAADAGAASVIPTRPLMPVACSDEEGSSAAAFACDDGR